MLRALPFALLLAIAADAAAESAPERRFATLASVQAFDAYLATLTELRGVILEDAETEREVAEGRIDTVITAWSVRLFCRSAATDPAVTPTSTASSIASPPRRRDTGNPVMISSVTV